MNEGECKIGYYRTVSAHVVNAGCAGVLIQCRGQRRERPRHFWREAAGSKRPGLLESDFVQKTKQVKSHRVSFLHKLSDLASRT